MFTSRAEYRLLLREDNADLRLTEIGRELGLVNEQRWQVFSRRREAIVAEQQRLAALWLTPARHADALAQLLDEPLRRETRAIDLLARPGVDYPALMQIEGVGPGVEAQDVADQVAIQARYAGYLARQADEIERQRRHDELKLPGDMDYTRVRGLSHEVKEKLSDSRPATLGQAARLPGITPAAVSLLLVHLRKSA